MVSIYPKNRTILFYNIKKTTRGKGVNIFRFWDDIVYVRPPGPISQVGNRFLQLLLRGINLLCHCVGQTSTACCELQGSKHAFCQYRINSWINYYAISILCTLTTEFNGHPKMIWQKIRRRFLFLFIFHSLWWWKKKLLSNKNLESALDFSNSPVWNIAFDELDFFPVWNQLDR